MWGAGRHIVAMFVLLMHLQDHSVLSQCFYKGFISKLQTHTGTRVAHAAHNLAKSRCIICVPVLTRAVYTGDEKSMTKAATCISVYVYSKRDWILQNYYSRLRKKCLGTFLALPVPQSPVASRYNSADIRSLVWYMNGSSKLPPPWIIPTPWTVHKWWIRRQTGVGTSTLQ